MTVKKEGKQFLRRFGPFLDALRALGGSRPPRERLRETKVDSLQGERETDL
jgi:hypothetical protein